MNASNSTRLPAQDYLVDLWLNHLAAAACVLLTAVVGTVVPVLLGICGRKQKKMSDMIISLGSCFGGGVFIAAGFVHLLPDAIEELGDVGFPWAECACALGLLGTMILDRAKEVCYVLTMEWQCIMQPHMSAQVNGSNFILPTNR